MGTGDGGGRRFRQGRMSRGEKKNQEIRTRKVQAIRCVVSSRENAATCGGGNSSRRGAELMRASFGGTAAPESAYGGGGQTRRALDERGGIGFIGHRTWTHLAVRTFRVRRWTTDTRPFWKRKKNNNNNKQCTYVRRERETKKKQLYLCNKRAFRSPQLASGARARTRSGGTTAADGAQCRQQLPKITTRVANIKTRFLIHRFAAPHVCFISLLLSLGCTFNHP